MSIFERTGWQGTLAALLLGAVFAAVDVGAAAAADGRGLVTYMGTDGQPVQGIRCGVVDRSPPLEVLQAMQRAQQEPDLLENARHLLVPVAFHVIRSDTGAGDVSNAQLQAQIEVLNAAYQDVGLQFEILSVDRTDNSAWYRLSPGSQAERDMKNALAIDPSTTLNFYTASPGGGLLGWAYFPYDFPESSPIHGVVVLNESLPGGTAVPYHLGDTGVHEVGHYVGLFHTFQNGCNRPGDYISDTPYEREPAFGCPIGRDTCSGPGEDPIFNFMDYVDDDCMDEFTRVQARGVRWALKNYRPGLLGGLVN